MDLTKKHKNLILYLSSALFILINSIALLFEVYYVAAFVFFLYMVYLSVFSMDKLLLLLVFCTPLAINVDDIGMGFGLSIPTEPVLAGILFVFLLRIFTIGDYHQNVLKHPVTLAILFNLIWIGITTLTSTMPFVSFKFLISRLWFIIPFYFLGVLLFKKYPNIKWFYWLYIIPFFGVIVYTIIHHSMYGFEQKPGHWVMTPFYKDHTSYGAMIAMFVPFLLGFAFDKNQSGLSRRLTGFMLLVFLVAIVLSYTRAAWVSLIGALIIYLILRFKINFKYIFLALVIAGGVFYKYQDTFLSSLEKNKQDSSTDFKEHIESISNISTDASNLERINRWNSAIRMFKEKPVFGFGPGTYMFQYAPYQKASEKTIISTNAGDLGNAHSEYIGPMAEQGLFGILSFLLIIITVSITTVKAYKKSNNPTIKRVLIVTYLGLITYLIHGILNNFLDSDKAAIPFWAMVAIIVAVDLYHNSDDKKELELKQE